MSLHSGLPSVTPLMKARNIYLLALRKLLMDNSKRLLSNICSDSVKGAETVVLLTESMGNKADSEHSPSGAHPRSRLASRPLRSKIHQRQLCHATLAKQANMSQSSLLYSYSEPIGGRKRMRGLYHVPSSRRRILRMSVDHCLGGLNAGLSIRFRSINQAQP